MGKGVIWWFWLGGARARYVAGVGFAARSSLVSDGLGCETLD